MNPFADGDNDDDDNDGDADGSHGGNLSSAPLSAISDYDDASDGASLFRDLDWDVADPAALERRLFGEVSALEAVRDGCQLCMRSRSRAGGRPLSLGHPFLTRCAAR